MSHVPDVVVTGLGATTPLGGDVASTWAAALNGESGARRFDDAWFERAGAFGIPVEFAATIKVDPGEVLTRPEQKKMDPSAQYAIIAAREAWADAGSPEVDGDRLGSVVSSGLGGLLGHRWHPDDPRRLGEAPHQPGRRCAPRPAHDGPDAHAQLPDRLRVV